MAKKRGDFRDSVPVWFVLCAAFFLCAACGGDSGASSDPEEDEEISSAVDESHRFSGRSSSSRGFFYSSRHHSSSSRGSGRDTIADTILNVKSSSYKVSRVFLGDYIAPLFDSRNATTTAQVFDKNATSCKFALASDKGCTFSESGIEATFDNLVFLDSKVTGKISLSAIKRVSDGDSIGVDFFTHLQAVRASIHMERSTYASSSDPLKASLDAGASDIWKSFDMDAPVGSKDSAGAMLALHMMIYEALLDKGATFLDSIANNIGTSGRWKSSSVPASIADLMILADAVDGYAGLRSKFAATNGANSGFEKHLQTFYQQELGVEACKASNANKILKVTNTHSRYAVTDISDYSKVKERFACNSAGKIFLVPDSLKDLYGLGTGKEGDVRVGGFTGNHYYTYEKGSWRPATSLERDSYFVMTSATSVFTDIKDVYEGIKPNERVIFVLRHAERGDDTSKGGTLTSNGKTQSSDVGKRLTKFSEDFVLGASEFLRAHQTVEYIARGRGQQFDIRDTFPELNDDWYIKNMDASEKAKSECGGGWELTSKYAYTGAYTTGANPAFYKLNERSVQLIEDVLLAKYNDPSQRFVILSSHDKVMVPLVVYCTNFKVNLKKHDGGKWLNYLAGIAIIIDELGNRRYVPVKGLSSAYM